MHKTKLTVELEVETQFGPDSAIKIVDCVTRIPAITSVNVIKLETDYVPPEGFPHNIELKAMQNIPKKIR